MTLMLFGIVTFVRFVHPEKALSPMFTTLNGIVTLVILLQFEKTLLLEIDLTGVPFIWFGIVISPPFPLYPIIVEEAGPVSGIASIHINPSLVVPSYETAKAGVE